MSLTDLQEPLTLLEQKEIDAAIETLEEKVNALPAHLVAHVLLARAYEAQQRWDQALQSWEDAHFLMPNSPVVKEGKRRVLRRMDGVEEDAAQSMVAAPETDELSETESTETTEEVEEDETSPEESPSETGTSSELAQLRRQAEREARQGGARSGLSEKSSTIDSPSSPDEPSSSPEEQIEKLEGEDSSDDLDRLIDELESARVDPDPDAEEAPEPDLEDDTEDVVSETLAQIHEGQNNYQEAARIYTQLAAQEPDRAEEFQQKAAEMREKADATEDPDA